MGEISFMKGYRVVFSALRRFTWLKIWQVIKLVVPNPVFAALSFYATLKAYTIAQKYFPKTNSTSGVGNAFRHALWCCLIMMYCCKMHSPHKALAFCKKVTDLHEELFPNDPLQKEMDLHNNSVGMAMFMDMLPCIHRQFFEAGFFIEVLVDKTKSARKVDSIKEINGSELVYLSD